MSVDILDPASHCYREDGCAEHQTILTDENCCCCGLPASDHTGCDCEELVSS